MSSPRRGSRRSPRNDEDIYSSDEDAMGQFLSRIQQSPPKRKSFLHSEKYPNTASFFDEEHDYPLPKKLTSVEHIRLENSRLGDVINLQKERIKILKHVITTLTTT